MALLKGKTEHSGDKRNRWFHRDEVKVASKKHRREADKKESRENLPDPRDREAGS